MRVGAEGVVEGEEGEEGGECHSIGGEVSGGDGGEGVIKGW